MGILVNLLNYQILFYLLSLKETPTELLKIRKTSLLIRLLHTSDSSQLLLGTPLLDKHLEGLRKF